MLVPQLRWLSFALVFWGIACGSLRSEDLLTIDNGTVKVGIDVERGGAITWLSWQGYPGNTVNLADPGRLIQQSYYAGKRLDRRAEGQHERWSPWAWNPIQGGGIGAWAKASVTKRVAAKQLYSETTPKLWDMHDEDADALMKQWTAFDPELPNTVFVECEFQAARAANDAWGKTTQSPQEIPACYFTRNFQQACSYLGNSQWRIEKHEPGPPWAKAEPPLNAMACFEKEGQGIGVYSPTANQHWNFGAHVNRMTDDPLAGPCMHLAPITRIMMGPTTQFRYRYWIVVGDAKQIAASLDALMERNPPVEK